MTAAPRPRGTAAGRVALMLLLLAAAAPAAAQTMRTTTAARQQRGEDRLGARVEFAAGTLTLRPAPAGKLYTMKMEFDAERFEPVSRYDAATGELLLGVRNAGGSGLRVSSRRHLAQAAVIELSGTVPLSLEAELGAVDAGLELGGLRLSDARIHTAASRTTLRFSAPNPGTCTSLELNAGAAEFAAYGLGNSRCRSIRFEGGVGQVTLDLTGGWTADVSVSARLTLGGLRLRLPRSAGVELSLDRFLASFSPAGFVRRGSGYVSENFERAARKIRIDVTSTVGEVQVEWE